MANQFAFAFNRETMATMKSPTLSLKIGGCCPVGCGQLQLKIYADGSVEIAKLPCALPRTARLLNPHCKCDKRSLEFARAACFALQRVWLKGGVSERDSQLSLELCRRKPFVRFIESLKHYYSKSTAKCELASYYSQRFVLQWVRSISAETPSSSVHASDIIDQGVFTQMMFVFSQPKQFLNDQEHLEAIAHLLYSENVLPSLQIQLIRLLGEQTPIERIALLSRICIETNQDRSTTAMDEFQLALMVEQTISDEHFTKAIYCSLPNLMYMSRIDLKKICSVNPDCFRRAIESRLDVENFDDVSLSAAVVAAKVDLVDAAPAVLEHLNSIRDEYRKELLIHFLKLAVRFVEVRRSAAANFLHRVVEVLRNHCELPLLLKSIGNGMAIRLIEQAILDPNLDSTIQTMYIDNLGAVGDSQSLDFLVALEKSSNLIDRDILEDAIFSLRLRVIGMISSANVLVNSQAIMLRN